MRRSWTLVTGASGFVGSRLVRRLVAQGEHVKAFVRDGANLRQLSDLPADRFRLAFGDILVGSTVYRALAGCDRLYHVASAFQWWAPRPEWIIGPAVEGTRGVLEAAEKRGVERIVVTSSVAALGNTESQDLMDESHVFDLKDPEIYALSKRRALDVTLEMVERGLPIVIVQPSAIAGPGDWKPTPVGQSILRFLNATYAIPSAPGGMSLADVDDVVGGHIAAMTRGTPGQSYILGGENITLEGLLVRLSELTRRPQPRGRLPPMLLRLAGLWFETHAHLTGSEPQLTRRLAKSHLGRFAWVSSEKAEKQLGYASRPAVETLRRSVQWFVSQGYVHEPIARRLPRNLHTLEAA